MGSGMASADWLKLPNAEPKTEIISPGAYDFWNDAALVTPETASTVCGPENGTGYCTVKGWPAVSVPLKTNITFLGTETFDRVIVPERADPAAIFDPPKMDWICEP